MNMGKRSEIMTAESVGPGVGLRTGGAKNHRPFNVFLAQPDSNPVSRSILLPRNPEFMRVSVFFMREITVPPLCL